MNGRTTDEVLREIERLAWADPSFVEELEESQRHGQESP